MGTAEFSKMNGRQLTIGRVRSPAKQGVQDKTAPEKTRRAASTNQQWNSKSKLDTLVCRYCGSDDLAPSFVKRRDRRCRKCFSKRYGSRARPTNKTKK